VSQRTVTFSSLPDFGQVLQLETAAWPCSDFSLTVIQIYAKAFDRCHAPGGAALLRTLYKFLTLYTNFLQYIIGNTRTPTYSLRIS